MTSTAVFCAAIVFIILAIIGFVGNLMTVIVLLQNGPLRRHSTTAFILSLCISDLICSSMNMPILAAALLNEDLMNHKSFCKLTGATFYSNFAITTFSIAGIAINRYILIVHHHLYKRFYSVPIVICQLVIIWLVPIAALAIPIMDEYGTIEKGKVFCKVAEKDGRSIEDLLFGIGILLPCLIIMALYARIYYKVREQSDNLAKHEAGLSSQTKDRERQLTLMIFLIFISFLVCCLPAVIEYLWLLGYDSIWPDVMGTTFCCLICIVNPFIYAAANRKYRAAYCQLFLNMKFWKYSDQRNKFSELG